MMVTGNFIENKITMQVNADQKPSSYLHSSKYFLFCIQQKKETIEIQNNLEASEFLGELSL